MLTLPSVFPKVIKTVVVPWPEVIVDPEGPVQVYVVAEVVPSGVML